MEIFSEKSPISFKIHRKSRLATKLKLSISSKLFDFLGTYTDDVLAEYIIVLVCNGKDQNQARDDLEAFLGESSGEFVSWLWDILLKYKRPLNSATGISTPSSPDECDTDKDMKNKRLKALLNDRSANEDSSRTQLDAIQRYTTENIHEDLKRGPSKVRGSLLVPSGEEQNIQCVDESKTIVNSSCNGSPHHFSYLPKRKMISNYMPSSTAEGPCTRQVFATKAAAQSSPREIVEVSCEQKKPRGSVWDRLGKPCERSLASPQIANAHSVDAVKQDQKVVDQNMSAFTGKRRMDVFDPDKGCIGINSALCMKKDCDVRELCKISSANNIRRKRHFGEITTDFKSGSVHLECETNRDFQVKESLAEIEGSSQGIRTLTLKAESSEANKPTVVSQVKIWKERLHQIESEMTRLRSKQLEMKKGAVKHSDEDVKSRTVFVTNVHFAATMEALSSYFSKCGDVSHVVILTDELNHHRKGSAYITFASKEAVDKALALSGTSFLSRTLKVGRKTDETVLISPPTQPRPASSHLQWRREPALASSDSSASITNEKGTPGFAIKQQSA